MPTIQVVIPVHEKDAHLSLRSLQYALTLDGKTDFTAIVAHEKGFEVADILDAARSYFAAVVDFPYDKWGGDPTWPQGANWAFQTIARFIESRTNSYPWLFWEPDSIPLKHGWLTILDEAYAHGQRPFAGAITAQPSTGTYMAGVGIWPASVSRYCQTAMLTRTQPFDVVASRHDGILSKTHDITPLICHTPLSTNTHFNNLEDVTREIPDTAVLFHKCKDGSLLDVIQGKIEEPSFATKASSSPATWVNVPSFTEQTNWESGYFTFPASTNTAYFNPSLLAIADKVYLFTRRERYSLEQITGGAMTGRKNDLAIWPVRPNMTLSPSVYLPSVPTRYPHEQWEDPRAVLGPDNLVYIGFATWVHHRQWAIRQGFTRLSQDWRKVEPLWETPYGGNTRQPTEGKTHEKNWIWFNHAGAWHCQYSINPGDVFKVDGAGNPIESWQTKEARHEWTTGLPLRGGTPPILLQDTSEYLAFFHTAIPWQKPKRRYFMGAYTFDAFPPFALRRITPTPLLVGSEHDFRALGGPLVIFPGGATFDGEMWTVAFGVNDEACGWIRIPHSDIDDRLSPVKRTVLEKLASVLA